MRSLNYGARIVASARKTTAFALLAIVSTDISAQEHQDRGHGAATIKTALELVADADTSKADLVLSAVHRSDSLYQSAMLIRAQLASFQGRMEDARTWVEKGLEVEGPLGSDLLTTRAAVLYDLKTYDACINACDSLISRYPGRFRAYHLKVLALWEKGDHKASVEQLINNVKRFPYHRDGHGFLARKAAEQGYTTLATLAGTMALVLNYGDDKAENMLTLVDAVLGGTFEVTGSAQDFGPKDELQVDLDELVKSRVAMDKRYKLEPDLDYPICRQSHLIFSEITKRSFEPGSIAAFYAPLAKEIITHDHFEGYIYNCLASSSYDKVRASADKNKSKVTAFRTAIATFIEQQYVTFPDEPGGEPLYHGYYDDSDLSGAGPLNAARNGRSGKWTFYHTNGCPSAQGEYLPTGERQGTWLNWYDNGRLSSSAVLERDVMNGPFVNYHPNGLPRDSCVMKNDLRQGTCCSFHPRGGHSACKVAVDNKWNGKVEEFNEAGGLLWRYTLKDEKAEGLAEQFYPDGTKRFTGTFAADKRTGTFIEYHPNGNKSEEYNYVDGLIEGPFTTWHSNGSINEKGSMVSGQRTGEVLEHDKWGTLIERRTYDDQGRLHGAQESMDDHGRIHLRTEYTKGLLTRYTYVDRTGKVLSEGTRSKGKFDMVGHTSEGQLKLRGTYLDEGLKEGTWTYFHPDGTLQSEENFKKGVSVGEQRYYTVDGTLARHFVQYTRNGIDYELFEEFHPSGAVRSTGQRKGKAYEGVYKKLAPDGTVMSIEHYVDDAREGWQEYYDVTGKLLYTERIENGAVVERTSHDEQGKEYERIHVGPGAFVLRTRYPSGGSMMEAQLMNGRFHGPTKWFYPDGKLEVECGYLNDERHGTYTSFHPNGKKRLEQTYRSGMLHGTSTEWFANGTQKSGFVYRDGSLEGTSTELHENGRTAFIRDYSNGELHGKHISHDLSGTAQLVRFYHKGALIGYASVKADGTFTDTIHTEQGVVRIASVFPSGGPARAMEYRNGELHGDFKEYHANGQPMETSSFRNDDPVGEKKEFYDTGKLRRITPYSEGVIHGEVISYHENGKEQERIAYRYGQKHGLWTILDAAGGRTAAYRMRNNDVVEILR